MKCLHSAFAVAVLCLAVFQFSENTADPDLWSHVFFGKQFIQTGKPTTIDYYSWTAYGQPSFDHEYLGEAVFGLAYMCLGGPGLLLLKIIVGILTFGIALSMGRDGAPRRHRPYSGRNIAYTPVSPDDDLNSTTMLVAWAFGALAVVEISFGFAARPQIFTALFLAIEMWLLRRVHSGNWQWALALPPMFALWFNLHGGALAGLVLVLTAAAATSVQIVLTKFAAKTPVWFDPGVPPRTVLALWISAIISAATVVINPHGVELARWLVVSVLQHPPEIEEWNPTTLGWDHAAFFFCAAFAAAAFILSRRQRQLWEAAVLAVLFLVAVRAVRNTPLFCIAALAMVPPHLADVLLRFRASWQRFEDLLRLPAAQRALTIILALSSAGIIAATFTLHKKHFWTMEVPRAQYPVAAIQFIQQHNLHGNLLVYFDWGEMCIWNLPKSPVSIDGRLDSVYSPAVIDAHWKLYKGEPFDTDAVILARADFALLPSDLAGAKALVQDARWRAVYYDHCAVVLVKNPTQFPRLAGLALPVQGPASATEGRDVFPN
ncbi:MAG TPA: hypothetical protein VGY56_01400 [Verrucomicrobiae bacterium]|nr:hypothetical protein [Verrucomicrobiae bacterium]